MMSYGVPRVTGYRDLRQIGGGAFSRVYEAYQVDFDRRVAIKVLNRRLADDDAVAGFEQECRSMGLLSRHPNIVTVLASGFTSDYRPCIVMDLYELGNYMQHLRDNGPLDLEELLPLGVQIAGALATAHQHGVIHGDVKPQNIFRSEFGYPALGDFGISTFRDRPADRPNVWLSPHYAAPELLEGGIRRDGRTIGSVFSRGNHPHARDRPATVRYARTADSSADAAPGAVRAPAAVARYVSPTGSRMRSRKPWRPEPDERFADLIGFGVALNGVEAELGRQPTSIPILHARNAEPLVVPLPVMNTSTTRPRSQSRPAGFRLNSRPEMGRDRIARMIRRAGAAHGGGARCSLRLLWLPRLRWP